MPSRDLSAKQIAEPLMRLMTQNRGQYSIEGTAQALRCSQCPIAVSSCETKCRRVIGQLSLLFIRDTSCFA
jgi:hypothetical protein